MTDINTKYRMKIPPHSGMFRDEALTYTARGVLGYLSTQISQNGYPVITPKDVPRAGIGVQKIKEILDLLVELGYMDVIE